jgi:hypothetical protein
MLIRPRDLAKRIADVQHPETIRLPIDAIRCKAREIINQSAQSGYRPKRRLCTAHTQVRHRTMSEMCCQ